MFDGLTHNISVKVNRGGLNVRTRKSYIARSLLRRAICGRTPGRVDGRGIDPAGCSPSRGRVVERAGVAAARADNPAARAGRRAARPAPPEPDGAEGADARARAGGVVTAVFNAGGRSVGTLRQTLTVTPQIGNGGVVSYDILQRLPAKPGRYELRIGLTNQTRQQAGSVYTFVDIPDTRAKCS